jgi:sarcosine oxidase
MIRQAYGEGADYIPLVLRAYELWEKLERDAETKLLFVTGGLILGPANGMVRRAAGAADRHGIPYEVLSGRETQARFPAVAPLAGDVALVEKQAGYLLPEECVRAQLRMAVARGAELHFEERVISWSADAGGVQVRTEQARYDAERLVIAAGPWAREALGSIVPLRVTRQVMAWIQPRGGIDAFLPGRLPVFLSECEDGRPAYGFPAVDGASGGVKAAVHGSDEVCTPATVDRSIRATDRDEILRKVSLRMPALAGDIVKAQTCLYTMTLDEHFVIGLHPEHPAVSIACGFSGHGFKFATVVGEILADLGIQGGTRHPIGMFSPLRFAQS